LSPPTTNNGEGQAPALQNQEGTMAKIEERVIASWAFKKGVLDAKTASLCYLTANLAVGNTH
jgi:hypothetical protein